MQKITDQETVIYQFGKPKDAAGIVTYLADDKANFIND